MARLILHIERAGLQTQIHDLGRPHHRPLGVPLSGVLDRGAARAANYLVGNPSDAPVMELTLWGPTIRFEGEGQIALTGADLSARLNDVAVECRATVSVQDGQVLSFGEAARGCRGYLGVRGTWQVKSWLDSVSPAPLAAERLTPHSVLVAGKSVCVETAGTLPPRRIVDRAGSGPLRIVPGPEGNQEVMRQLTSQPHRVSIDSNRMGCRLESHLSWTGPALISSCVVPGTIQRMAGGQPVVLLADAQTTGGYPRMAHVITADLDRLAQFKPGDTLQFVQVSPDMAAAALKKLPDF